MSGNGNDCYKFYNLLGLAMRAGKVVSGDEIVLKKIRSGELHLVILSSDASENTKKKILDKCRYYGVEAVVTGDRARLGHAIGKGERVVIGITEPGFARQLRKLTGDSTGVIE